MQKAKKYEEILTRGVEEVIIKDHLEKMLASGKKLRIKFGIDPTFPDLHLGHVVQLRKLKAFQDAGHTIVLIIGDFTAMIGDPSGRNETRPPLTEKQAKYNMKKYLVQAGKILNIKKAEVRSNSAWYKKGGVKLFFDLMMHASVQRVLERDDFQKRLREEREITMLETLYPLFQGYDSVAVRSDVEIGGTDQKFNLLMGRRLQRQYGMHEQAVMTLPLLLGTDGTRKMSKSYGNAILLSDAPDDMFGKVMSLPDTLMDCYFELLTDMPDANIEKIKNAMERKLTLAEDVVKMIHGAKRAASARNAFLKLFSKKNLDDIPKIKLPPGPYTTLEIVSALKYASSKSEARRLIRQGAVEIDGNIQTDPHRIYTSPRGLVIRVGKKKFARLV